MGCCPSQKAKSPLDTKKIPDTSAEKSISTTFNALSPGKSKHTHANYVNRTSEGHHRLTSVAIGSTHTPAIGHDYKQLRSLNIWSIAIMSDDSKDDSL